MRFKKPKLDNSITVTAGVTADDNYSLAIQKFGDNPCVCIHECDKVNGWHYSLMNKKSLITAIDYKNS